MTPPSTATSATKEIPLNSHFLAAFLPSSELLQTSKLNSVLGNLQWFSKSQKLAEKLLDKNQGVGEELPCDGVTALL